MLSDSRVGTISANKDVAVVYGAIRASGNDVLVVLVEGDNLLAEADVLAGDLTPKQVVQLWAGSNICTVSGTGLYSEKRKKKLDWFMCR